MRHKINQSNAGELLKMKMKNQIKSRIAAMNVELKNEGINYTVHLHPNSEYQYSIGEKYSRTREYTNSFGYIVEQVEFHIRLAQASPVELLTALFI